MKAREINTRVRWMGAVDWDRLFDSLIPLPDGTSYNAYLIQDSETTALLDTVDPAWPKPCCSNCKRCLRSIILSPTMQNRTTPEPCPWF